MQDFETRTLTLRPYQNIIAAAILDSVLAKQGLTFTVEIARQGGKNEISAQLERWLLVEHYAESKNLIKCSPTFRPQAFISLQRLKERLDQTGFRGIWTAENGNMLRLGDARAIFLSADSGANVVGNTAHLLIEVDEAQDVSEEKYTKEFRPMGSTTNVTNVLYGTTWDDSTLLEKMKQTNLELERMDGIRRHFSFDWQEVAKYNPEYLGYVQAERTRLGENHPFFMTQYRLLPIHGGGGFLNSTQKAQLQGTYTRLSHPPELIKVSSLPGSRLEGTDLSVMGIGMPSKTENCKLTTVNSKIYIAGIDLAGEAETCEDDFLRSIKPRLDSTVITIAELTTSSFSPGCHPEEGVARREDLNHGLNVDGFNPARPSVVSNFNPSHLGNASNFPSPSPSLITDNCKLNTIRVVEHYSWSGIKHPDLYARMVDILKNVWHCKLVVVDATGIGQPVASFLRQALGSRIVPFVFTASAKTELGFNLLAAINSGSLKMYAPDNSAEYAEFWFEMEKAKGFYRPNRTLNFFVDPSEGHDDYLMSLALVVQAAKVYSPRHAYGQNRLMNNG